jgi:hypothetical protein
MKFVFSLFLRQYPWHEERRSEKQAAYVNMVLTIVAA